MILVVLSKNMILVVLSKNMILVDAEKTIITGVVLIIHLFVGCCVRHHGKW
jgi:hypothetical protein